MWSTHTKITIGVGSTLSQHPNILLRDQIPHMVMENHLDSNYIQYGPKQLVLSKIAPKEKTDF